MNPTEELLGRVCQAIYDKKGEGVLVLDVSKVSSFADYFVICHGLNRRQNQAISDAITEKLERERGASPSHVEGYEQAEWILLDYLDFVVHVFSVRARQFYKLERLWNDAAQVEAPTPLPVESPDRS
jgi:ribosome-associated protein